MSDFLIQIVFWVFPFAILFYLIKRFRKKKVKKIYPNQFHGEINLKFTEEIDFNKYVKFILVSSYVNPIYLFVSFILLFFLINIDYGSFLLEKNPLYILPIFLFFLYVAQPIFTYFNLKKIYKKSNILNEETNYIITKESIQIIGSMVNSKIKWELFTDFKETKDFFIFYSSKTSATFLQKSWFAEEELSEFHKFLNSTMV